MPSAFEMLIARSPVVPAVRHTDDLARAIAAPSQLVYLLAGDVTNVASLVKRVRDGGKEAFVNVDMLGGLSGDAAGIAFLADASVAGVISTRAESLRAARKRRLLAIQRGFLLDSQAVNQILRALDNFEPDALELLPAPAAPRVVDRISAAHPNVGLTAGGLVASLAEVDALVRIGIKAVSISNPELWIA